MAFRASFTAFLISLGVLTIEISLTRVLSFTLWYHFTYVAIAVALLGYGASGAALASWERLARVLPHTLITNAALLGAFSVTLALLVIRWVPFQPLDLASDPTQLVWMSLYLLAIMLPFFAAGVVIAAVLRNWREITTVIYFADLLGGGLGCAAAIPAIWWLGAPGGVAAGAAAFACAAVVMVPPERRVRVISMSALAAILAAGTAAGLAYRPSPDKFLGKLMARGISPIYTRWSPIFRVDLYETSLPGNRRGTSSEFKGEIPKVRFIAHDGTAEAAMYRFTGNPDELEFFDWNIASAPYQILEEPQVLIIGLGGGFDVLAAIRGGASRILGCELDPITVQIVRDHSAGFAGGILQRPEVETVVAEGRSFLRSSSESYDLIQLTGVDTLSALSTGAYVLAESYLYTVEAMRDYLSHLSENGILSFMIGDLSWKQNKARFSLRHVGNFLAAAEELGWSNPAAHTVVIGSPGGVTMLELMFKKSPFTREELATLDDYARTRGFDVWAFPGTRTGSPLETLLTGSASQRAELLRSYPLDVRETTDDRPFFFHFFRWSDLLGVGDREIDRGHTGATGQIVLGVLLVFGIAASILLIVAPLLLSSRIALATRGSLRFATYFGGIGLGFMLLEISLIQRFVLFLGHPTYAIATVLATLLVSTGLGSFLSGRVSLPPRSLILPTLLIVGSIAAAHVLVLPDLFDMLLGAPRSARVALTITFLMPLGLALGVFFPSGLRIVSEVHPDFIPWAWGVNGGASVVGSILATVLGISLGFSAVTLGGLGVYVLGVAALLSVRERSHEGDPRT